MTEPFAPAPVAARLGEFRDAAADLRDTLLANLILVGEIPAPTFGEAGRARFLVDRFTEDGLASPHVDEAGNAVARLEGTGGTEGAIVVVAHLDSEAAETAEHHVSVHASEVSGVDVADNSLGVAALATLPSLLQRLGLSLRRDLILVGAARSLGRGNLEGLRSVLTTSRWPLHAGIALEGLRLGQLCLSSIGMARGEIVCRVPDEYDWSLFGAQGAIMALVDVINGITEIPLPKRPRTAITLGSVEAGQGSYNALATDARLRMEVRSESGELVEELVQRIDAICAEVAGRTGASVSCDFFARRRPGGVGFTHPLAHAARAFMAALDVKPLIGPSTSELSSFMEASIPAVRIGLTLGSLRGSSPQVVQVEPCFTGLALLAGLLLAVDGGCCDVD